MVATDGPTASQLLGGEPPAPVSVVATRLYFAADRAPVDEPVIVLDGDGQGPVNNLCVPSAVAPTYAPPGAALISAAGRRPGLPKAPTWRPPSSASSPDWFGSGVVAWRHLKTYHIPHAQPAQPPGTLDPPSALSASAPACMCGDHRDNASINGALASGRTADAVLGGPLRISGRSGNCSWPGSSRGHQSAWSAVSGERPSGLPTAAQPWAPRTSSRRSSSSKVSRTPPTATSRPTVWLLVRGLTPRSRPTPGAGST